MRQERTVQASLFDLFAEHEIGRELKAMSQWLDEHRDLLNLVARDLRRHGVKETGRQGLPAEAVLRCALLKQHRQLSYEELAFHLEDSASFRAFARLPWGWSPKKSVLHKTISAIRAQTWEELNRVLLASARQDKLENGQVVRVDSTVTAALIHEPSDSSLLWDCMRVMVRLLQQADALGGTFPWHDHCRAAKKRSRTIEYGRGRPKRVKLYRELLKITRTTLSYLQQASEQLPLAAGPAGELWQTQVRHYRPLVEQIIVQTERRVLTGESVPAGEKLVSLFEPHADIIVKGSRDVDYGHKLNLTTGRSGLILDPGPRARHPERLDTPASCGRTLLSSLLFLTMAVAHARRASSTRHRSRQFLRHLQVSANRRLACAIGAWTGGSGSLFRAWLSRGVPFGKRRCSWHIVGRNQDRRHRGGEVLAGDGPIDYCADRRNSRCTTVEVVLQSSRDSRTGTGGLRIDEDVYRDEIGGHRLGLRAG